MITGRVQTFFPGSSFGAEVATVDVAAGGEGFGAGAGNATSGFSTARGAYKENERVSA